MLASDSPSHTRHRIPEWLEERSAGLLLHISSLPSGFGIGNLGKCSHDLIDFLAESGFRFWQICPVGPTGFGDSPYQTFSSIAGNPYFIDWNPIVEAGLVDEGDLNSLRTLPDAHVDYGILYEKFWPVAEKAADRFVHNPSSLENLYGSYDTFLDEHASWLEPYALFQAIKADNGKKPWWLWPEEMRSHGKARQRPEKPTLAKDVHLHRFLQYVFLGQWKRLRDYAHSRNIRILGDLPIYVAPDCTEVWQRPDLFQLDITTGLPAAVAGVPPDYFNPDGQLWGNPLYDWPAHENEGYAWWLERLASQVRLFDVTRIDHFRGFHDYWSISAEQEDAREGQWEPGPGLPFFEAVRHRFPDLPFLAEDLGLLSKGVHSLRRDASLPGMAILQFAFDGDPGNLYLPHNLSPDLVTYSGTHDNDTFLGWYETAGEEIRDNFRSYLNVPGHDAPWDILRAAYRTVSRLCIIPMQDLLSLGSEARLNRPGEPSGNWAWRLTESQLDTLHSKTAEDLRGLAKLTGRFQETKANGTRTAKFQAKIAKNN